MWRLKNKEVIICKEPSTVLGSCRILESGSSQHSRVQVMVIINMIPITMSSLASLSCPSVPKLSRSLSLCPSLLLCLPLPLGSVPLSEPPTASSEMLYRSHSSAPFLLLPLLYAGKMHVSICMTNLHGIPTVH